MGVGETMKSGKRLQSKQQQLQGGRRQLRDRGLRETPRSPVVASSKMPWNGPFLRSGNGSWKDCSSCSGMILEKSISSWCRRNCLRESWRRSV